MGEKTKYTPAQVSAMQEAAPEMYEALRNLVNEYGKAMSAMRVDAPRRELWRNACIALEKATAPDSTAAPADWEHVLALGKTCASYRILYAAIARAEGNHG